MTDRPPETDADTDREARYHSLVDLHARAGAIGDVDDLDGSLIPRSRRSSMRASAEAVAAAPEDEIPMSARLAVLYNLSRADVTRGEAHERDYQLLAKSVAKSRGLTVKQLLGDLKQAASEAAPLRATPTGQALPAHETVFIGESVCTTRTVKVNGLRATWIYSEFDTDAPFAQVAAWVDPRNWPDRGPLMFKRMDIVGAAEPVNITALSDDHWHGVFHEEVQLVRRLNTLLHCDHWRDGDEAAGMTYQLDLSLDAQINVDQGFLTVNDTGPVRRVKALKVVGFTEDLWDQVARYVCPFWTDWMRSAVRGGTVAEPRTPTGTGLPQPSPLVENLEAWGKFFGESARSYLDLFEDVTARMGTGRYSTSDAVADGTRYWSKLAKDWAQAWTYGVETANEVAREGLDAGFAPPGAPRESARGAATAMAAAAAPTPLEGTVVPVTGLGENDRPACSDLVSIEAGGAKIAAQAVTVGVEHLGGETFGARLQTTDASAPSGLYVGRLKAADGRELGCVQLYVSRAMDVGT